MARTLEVVIQGKDEASRAFQKASGAAGKLKTALAGMATVAGGMLMARGIEAAVGAIGDMVSEVPRINAMRTTFDRLAQSIGSDGVTAMQQLRVATRGMVSDADLLSAGNRFLAMGLADTSDEAAQLAEVATQLGSAMGEDAAGSMENFALMLANQSIPRLDSFGISSGRVRERINELMESTQGLTREEAFMQAVMEEAELTMAKVGEQGDNVAGNIARLKASFDNAKIAIGEAFMPVVSGLIGLFADLAAKILPKLVAAFRKAMSALVSKIETLQNALGYLTRISLDRLFLKFEDGSSYIGGFLQRLGVSERAAESMASAIIGVVNKLKLFVNAIQGIIKNIKHLIQWGEALHPAEYFEDFWKLSPRVQSAFSVVLEAIQGVVWFIMENKDAIINALRTIGEFLLNAFAKAAVIGGIMKIIALVTSLMNPIALITAAIGFFATAWANNWFGIRDIVAQAIETIRPIIENVIAWFQVFIPQAMAAVSSFVQTTLMPIFVQLAEFFVNTLLPAIMSIVQWFVEQWPLISETVLTVFEAIVEAIETILPPLVEMFMTIFGSIVTWFQENWPLISETITTVFTGVMEWIQENLPPIIEAITTILVGVIEWVTENWPRISGTIGEVFNAVSSIVGGILSTVVPFITDQLGSVVGWVSENWPAIQGTIETVMGAIQTVVGEVLGTIKGFWDTHGGEIMTIVETAWNTIKTTVETTITLVQGIIRAIMFAIKGDWDGVWNTIKALVFTVWNAIKTIIGNILTTIQTVIQTGLGTARQIVATIFHGIMDTVIFWLLGVVGKVRLFFGTTIPNLIRSFAGTFAEAGRRLIQAMRDAMVGALEQAANWFRDRLQQLRNMLPFSEPRDPRSPLRGLSQAGTAIGQSLLQGLQASMPAVQSELQAQLAGISGATQTTNTNVYHGNQTQTINVNDQQAMALLMDRQRVDERSRLGRRM